MYIWFDLERQRGLDVFSGSASQTVNVNCSILDCAESGAVQAEYDDVDDVLDIVFQPDEKDTFYLKSAEGELAPRGAVPFDGDNRTFPGLGFIRGFCPAGAEGEFFATNVDDCESIHAESGVLDCGWYEYPPLFDTPPG